MLNPKISIKYFFATLLIFFWFAGCKDDPITPPDQNDSNNYDNLVFSDKIELNTYPTFGSKKTDFKISLKLNDNTLKVKQIKYDLTNDKTYDITKSLTDTVKNKFQSLGYNKIIATIFLEDNTALSCSIKVWISDPELILSDGFFFYEPNA